MKVLLGTHHLEVRAGSELFTAELASSIRSRGNEVAVFTFFKGDLAELIEADGIRVFDPDDAAAIAQFDPDIVQTNHLPCAHFLRALIPGAIRVHAMLGVTPHLEAPPLDAGAYSLGLAISEEVRDRINQSSFGRDVDVAIFRNWFDDRAVLIAEARKPHRPLRVAVVSNHFAPDLINALDALEAAGDTEIDYFGAQRESVPVDGALLSQYDLVISIGRTVLLAAACRVPCIMADVHGSDGLLTIDNLDQVRAVNFSGRMKKQRITRAHLEQEIGKLFLYDREELRKRVTANYALSGRTEWLLSRYDRLLANRRDGAKTHHASPAFLSVPSEGFVHAEITAMVRNLRKQLVAAAETLQRERAEVDRERAPSYRLVDLKRSRSLKVGRFLRRVTARFDAFLTWSEAGRVFRRRGPLRVRSGKARTEQSQPAFDASGQQLRVLNKRPARASPGSPPAPHSPPP